MSDLMAIVMTLACFALTGGLVVLCDRLSPREKVRQERSKP